MELSSESLLQARELAGHNQVQAAAEIQISLNTLVQAEKGNMPKNVHLRSAIRSYVQKHLKKAGTP